MVSLRGEPLPKYTESSISERNSLFSDLNGWHARTRELRLPDVNLSTAMARDRLCYRPRRWFEMLYHNAVLMLYRPSLMLPNISQNPVTLRNIFWSAKQSTTLYYYLHRPRKINHSWLALQSVIICLRGEQAFPTETSCCYRWTNRTAWSRSNHNRNYQRHKSLL